MRLKHKGRTVTIRQADLKIVDANDDTVHGFIDALVQRGVYEFLGPLSPPEVYSISSV